MIYIYHGDGKGKTTAALGLAIRAMGSGMDIIFSQFLKDDISSEFVVLRELEHVKIFHADEFYGFVWEMSEEEKLLQKDANEKLLKRVEEYAKENASKKLLIVLDEVLHAVNNSLLSQDMLCEFLDEYSETCEIVLTGTNPSEELVTRGDYITEIKKVKHPFDMGVEARKGIEF